VVARNSVPNEFARSAKSGGPTDAATVNTSSSLGLHRSAAAPYSGLTTISGRENEAKRKPTWAGEASSR
jgi:hypothetical protein